MLHRILPAISLMALAGCQTYATGTSPFGVNSYAPQRGPALTGTETTSASRGYAPFNPAQMPAYGAPTLTPAVFTPTPSAKPPPVAPGGIFHEIDPHGGDVGFWNEDPVAKRETATYADRYVERISLRNGGVITYEMLNRGAFSDESDADLIKADLALPPFRARGIRFEPDKLERLGPFTYLAQSSATNSCFIFRGKFGGAATGATEEAYGNICYAREAKELASIKAEMLDLLAHARFGQPAGATLAAAGSEPAQPVAGAAPPPAPSLSVTLERCRSAVSFSAAPAAAGKDHGGGKFTYADGNYSEEASCSCKADVDYAKLSQFDAVDNVRRLVEARGFKLQKATFADTPDLGKALAFEAVAEQEAGEAFLIGRSFYGQCGLSLVTTGISYAELRKARKFVDSVTAVSVPAETTAAVSDAIVSNAGPGQGQPDAAPDAVPLTPVAKAEAGPAEAPAADTAAAAKPDPAPAEPPAAAPTLAAARPAEDAAAGAGSGSTTAADAAQPVAADETAQRLRRLKLLHDQNLITPEEYEAKRQAILKSL